MRKAMTDKIFVMGIDGLDPRLTKKYMDAGKMPNTAEFVKRGACREDLAMLGALPTVTPPMWTTLATGAYPNTHGITCFYRMPKGKLDHRQYNFDSTNCLAEPLWNVLAEDGKKTLVWAWPGSSWPPTSDNPNLHVVDGTQPVGVNIGAGTVEMDIIAVASTKTEAVHYRAKGATDGTVPCMLTDLTIGSEGGVNDMLAGYVVSDAVPYLVLEYADGTSGVSSKPFDIALSPIKEASGWAAAPKDAKEFTLLTAGGLIHRPGLILKNADGIYDTVALYKNKKATEPFAVLPKDVYVDDVIEDSFKGDTKVQVCRAMRLLEISEDGEKIKIWLSGAVQLGVDTLFHPRNLYQEVTENVGYPKVCAVVGGSDQTLLEKCMLPSWNSVLDWNARALNHLMANGGYSAVFSQVHNVDAQGHMIVKYLKDKGHSPLPEEVYADILEQVYVQTDEYIGKYLHLLDEGWTVLIISDHGQVCPEHEPPMIGDLDGVSVRLMQELGFTEIKKDENGKDLYEIDWSKTRAIANRGNHIYINLKGRDEHGIVEPEDKYELEEEIMTALYGYKDKVTGKRVIALALRNKDAALLGMGGPECGDILVWNAEGYNYDHCDSISTTFGYADTSVAPIFIASGKGIKRAFILTV